MDHTVPITIRSSGELRRQIQSKAKAEGTSVQAIVLSFLRQWLTGNSPVMVRELPSHAGEPKINGVTIAPEEIEAVELLLQILRHGKAVHKEAVMWNLRGWAESATEATGGDESKSTTFSEAIDRMLRAAEQLSEDEAARREWLDDLRRFQAESRDISKPSRKSGTHGRKRRS